MGGDLTSIKFGNTEIKNVVFLSKAGVKTPLDKVCFNTTTIWQRKFSVKVINGSGDGEYSVGQRVYISALDRSSENLAFDHWNCSPKTPPGFNINSSSTNFSMDATTYTFTAIYKSAAVEKHNLNFMPSISGGVWNPTSAWPQAYTNDNNRSKAVPSNLIPTKIEYIGYCRDHSNTPGDNGGVTAILDLKIDGTWRNGVASTSYTPDDTYRGVVRHSGTYVVPEQYKGKIQEIRVHSTGGSFRRDVECKFIDYLEKI